MNFDEWWMKQEKSVTNPISPRSVWEAAWNAALTQINTPEIKDFLLAVENEALHQRMRWGSEHDAGKTDQDWFWLIGYLAQKPLYPGCTLDKSLHHMVTTAAACLNWHAHKMGVFTMMRPDIVSSAPTFKETPNDYG